MRFYGSLYIMAEISCALEVLLYSGSVTDDLPLTLGLQGLTSYRQSQMSIFSLSKHFFPFCFFGLTEFPLQPSQVCLCVSLNGDVRWTWTNHFRIEGPTSLPLEDNAIKFCISYLLHIYYIIFFYKNQLVLIFIGISYRSWTYISASATQYSFH